MKTSARPTSPALTEEFRGRLAAMRRRLVRTVATTDQLARLRALPATRYCGPCQARLESGR